MAYKNWLASVNEHDVATFRSDLSLVLRPSRVSFASHLIGTAGWNDALPLRTVLSRALDGGDLLSPSLWHPLRPPMYHSPRATSVLAAILMVAWDRLISKQQLSSDDWLLLETERVISLFNFAAERDEGVVSVLEPPYDAERAARVHMPIEIS